MKSSKENENEKSEDNKEMTSGCESSTSSSSNENNSISKESQEAFLTPSSSVDADFDEDDENDDCKTTKDNEFNDGSKCNGTLRESPLVAKEVQTADKEGEDEESIGNQNLKLMSNISFFSQEKESLKASIRSKASPLTLSSWIAVALTLDGRDKITKVIQYTSRLLGYYYETVAEKHIIGTDDIMKNSLYAIYSIKAQKYRRLYKAMNTSRKAFRFGRTIIELEKLKSMGLIHWIAWYVRKSMFIDNGKDQTKRVVTPIRQDSTVSFHPDTKFKDEINNGTGLIKRVPKISLPHRISSNIGFKPSFLYITDGDDDEPININKQSYIGKFLFRSLSSMINEDLMTTYTKENKQTPPPLWKIISSALKLLGLAGFWAGDNISYLHSIGFLVDGKDSSTITKGRKKRGEAASLFAMKSYFLGAVAGLYLNSREWAIHRNGPYRKLLDDINRLEKQLNEHKALKHGGEALEEHNRHRELEKLHSSLEVTKQKHFTLCLALLKVSASKKSFCFTIESQGIDFTLKCHCILFIRVFVT